MNKELVLWAKYDVERAIPSVVDGLKPGQRKVLYSAFLKKLTQEKIWTAFFPTRGTPYGRYKWSYNPFFSASYI